MTVGSINAITLAVSDMDQSVRFYESVGFRLDYRSPAFSTFHLGGQALNLTGETEPGAGFWGRVIFYVADVDRMYATVVDAGHSPEAAPADATWGERFFHLNDPDGHQLSFAKPLDA
jgi:catechol 2,3-dioxygenase-like lactoylglutathione lyase family enzyme